MIFYAFYQYFSFRKEQKDLKRDENRIISRTTSKSALMGFLTAVSMLIVLDLAGDATEVLTIVFVARYQNLILVFVSCVAALVAASAIETVLGNRLGKLLSIERIKIFSLVVFLAIGSLIILSSIFNFSF